MITMQTERQMHSVRNRAMTDGYSYCYSQTVATNDTGDKDCLCVVDSTLKEKRFICLQIKEEKKNEK